MLLVAAAGAYSFSPRTVPPLEARQIPVNNMLLNSVVTTQAGLLAAGELGHILLSTDQGKTWADVQLPEARQALITRLVFEDDKTGLAIGHEGWIMRTNDGGRTWEESAFEKINGAPLMSAARLPSGDWLAVGAFGRVLKSDAERKEWHEARIDALADWHLNALAASADRKEWLLVGEAGAVLRSADGGQNWSLLKPFYDGSFYGAVHLGAGSWLVYGMRGNVFRTTDHGESWSKVALPIPVSLYGHALTPEGRLVLVGQGGTVFVSDDQGQTLSLQTRLGRGSLTDIRIAQDGQWYLSGEQGFQTYTPTKPGQTTNKADQAGASR